MHMLRVGSNIKSSRLSNIRWCPCPVACPVVAAPQRTMPANIRVRVTSKSVSFCFHRLKCDLIVALPAIRQRSAGPSMRWPEYLPNQSLDCYRLQTGQLSPGASISLPRRCAGPWQNSRVPGLCPRRKWRRLLVLDRFQVPNSRKARCKSSSHDTT